jgi:hypothetical protein
MIGFHREGKFRNELLGGHVDGEDRAFGGPGGEQDLAVSAKAHIAHWATDLDLLVQAATRTKQFHGAPRAGGNGDEPVSRYVEVGRLAIQFDSANDAERDGISLDKFARGAGSGN